MVTKESNITMFDFRRIGDLQDYGEPYISLYVNKSDESLYMAIKSECKRLTYILLCVTPTVVNTYMQGQLPIRNIIEESSLLLQRTKSGNRWEINPVSIQFAQNLVSDDGIYEPEFCYDKYTIEHYLNSFKQ